jgi:hypothetical protein
MTAKHVRLNYLHDTLFGPIAKSIDCEVVITPITPGAFQVQVLMPVPDDLHRAHTVNITLSLDHHMVGAVVHTQKLGNGDLELQIDV